LKLFNPKSEPEFAEDRQMLKNCIVLFYPNYTVMHNETENTFIDLNDLSTHLHKNASLLTQRKFYVIIDSNTKFEKIVSVLNLLQKNKIDNYKVINYQEYFKPPEPVTYEAPTETVPVTKAFDSSYLSVIILEDSIELLLFDKKQIGKCHMEVDKFITDNKVLIDSNKIVIRADAKIPYKKLKLVLDVLKKHEYYKFKMISQ